MKIKLVTNLDTEHKLCPNLLFLILYSTNFSFIILKVATNLDAELHKFEDRGHFMDQKFPELIKAVKNIVDSSK